MMVNLFIVGPAGSGKSTLVKALSEWMASEGIGVFNINLDPGAESVGYRVDFDIRELVTVGEIMKREGLGPNGALIRAAEIIEGNLQWLVDKIGRAKADYRIFDTPGQMEIFLFRSFGPSLASKIEGRSAAIFTIDPLSLSTALDIPVIKLFSLVIELRLGIPAIEALTKFDLESSQAAWHNFSDVRPQQQLQGISGELALALASVVGELEKKKRIIPVSARTNKGIADLYYAVGELFCSCGDMS